MRVLMVLLGIGLIYVIAISFALSGWVASSIFLFSPENSPENFYGATFSLSFRLLLWLWAILMILFIPVPIISFGCVLTNFKSIQDHPAVWSISGFIVAITVTGILIYSLSNTIRRFAAGLEVIPGWLPASLIGLLMGYGLYFCLIYFTARFLEKI